MNKSELIDWLEEQYQQWEAFLDQIDPALMEQPGVAAHWSIKDIVAHLNGWQQNFVERFQAAHRGQPEPPPHWPEHLQEEDEINAWIYESGRGRSLSELLDESEKLFEQVLDVVKALPDDVRIEHVEPVYYLVWIGDERYVVGEFFDHFRDDHEPDIRAWLERSPGEG